MNEDLEPNMTRPSCPACGEAGSIPLHSVWIELSALADYGKGGRERAAVELFTKCLRCAALFWVGEAGALRPAPAGALSPRSLWVLPPWKQARDASSFEASWDVAEAHLEQQAITLEWVAPLYELLGQLRRAGLDQRLRAGQSNNALGLSRALRDGLAAGQSYLYLIPEGDGRVRLEGELRGQATAEGSMPARFEGSLRRAVEALCEVELDG
ncbi:hypothetical protein G6O69_14375 [Pseudenhygromyxa sp. WMMC2535]|uniref:hypothetical protein n=1 Tax=Pseudenhygromyxa sp. WMMC2535 TaxID=2712867 RepID=UPI0015545267|nr:hypothetical protein [Pseudenhygromyxa sp. WMMC2535]NVB39025.1 hypothetical protein [Pseudenhygromyxa sp. WMMC2535]